MPTRPTTPACRALVSKAFTTRIVEQLHTQMTAVAHELVDKVQVHRSADLIEDYAFPLPIIVIADLLGVPARDRQRFRAWTNALVVPTPDSARNEKKLLKARTQMEDFIAYLRAIFATRRAQPRGISFPRSWSRRRSGRCLE